MHRPKEYSANQDPQPGRSPSIDHGHNRTNNGAGAGNGCKVVCKHDRCCCGDVVASVVYFNRGRNPFRIDPHFPGYESGIETACQ